jgi:hypothetical protein
MIEPAERATAVTRWALRILDRGPIELNESPSEIKSPQGLTPAPRARRIFLIDPGVSLRSTRGFTLSPASRAGEPTILMPPGTSVSLPTSSQVLLHRSRPSFVAFATR